MNKRHYEHTLPNIRGSLSNTYSAYREMFLTRKMTGARRQTYIDESLYETLTGILPVIAPGISVPTFVNNVLAEHMEKYRDIIDETCHRKFKEMMVWKDSSICR